MSVKTIQYVISGIKYLHSCIFSPSTVILVAMYLGFIPFTVWAYLLCIGLPMLEGFTSGMIKSLQKAFDELVSENT